MVSEWLVYGAATGVAIAFIVALGFYVFAPARFLAAFMRLARRLCGLATKSVRVGDTEWPYLVGGPADAPVVVLVHGFCGEKDNWTTYARALTRHYRVVIPDLPGFGANVKDAAGKYGIDDQVAYLRAFLDALGIDRCHLGGNSMGGFIGLRFALQFPQRLDSLTIFDGAGVTGEVKSGLERAVERGENPFDVDSMADVERFIRFVMQKRVWLPRIYKRVALDQMREHRALLNRLFDDLVAAVREQPLNDELARIAAPTLVLWGRHDRLIDVSCAAVMADAIPDCEMTILEDVGHVPMMEAPAATARRHLAFLDERRAVAG